MYCYWNSPYKGATVTEVSASSSSRGLTLEWLQPSPSFLAFRKLYIWASQVVGPPGKEHTCQCRRCGFDPWVRKIPWSKKCQPTPVFLPGDPMDRLLSSWNSPGKNSGVGWHFLLQGIFLTQGSNPGLLHCIAGRFFTRWVIKGAQIMGYKVQNY